MFVGISLMVALEEAAIERTTSRNLTEIVQSLQHDMEQSDRELLNTLEFAERLCGILVPNSDETTADGCTTLVIEPASIATTAAITTSMLVNEGNKSCINCNGMVPIPATLAANIAKVLCKSNCISTTTLSTIASCHTNTLQNGIESTDDIQIPVTTLVQAMQILLDEREAFLQEALDLMRISRRTVDMVMLSEEAQNQQLGGGHSAQS